MANSEEIPSSEPLLAFGDESVSELAAVYALVVVPERSQHWAEGLLLDVKRKMGIDPSARLHCRELFHHQSRAKTPFAALNDRQVHEMYYNIAMNLFPGNHAKCFLGIVDRKKAPAEYPQAGPFRATPLGPKALCVFAMQAASTQLQVSLKEANIEWFVDGDSTRVQFFSGSRQVGQLYNPWLIKDAKPVQPIRCAGDKPALLEVADYASFVAAKAFGKGTQSQSPYQTHFNALHATSTEFNFDVAGFLAHAPQLTPPKSMP